MKSFKAFITEAEVNPQSYKPKDPLPFKEPESNPLQTGPRRVRRKSSAGPGTTAEPEAGSRTSRTRTSALRPEYFDADGNLRPEAARRFAERRAGKGYSRAGETLTPERKAALDQVDDLFKRFDAGDADAASEVKSIRDRIIQKHGAANNHPSFRQVTTGTSPAPSDATTQQLRDMQGRKGQAPLDPALQQAASDRLSGQSTSQTIDNPGRPEQSVMDKTRAAADARRAGVADAGTPTPRPGVRTDDVLDAIRNVPDEPQLPKIRVTGGESRPTDLPTRVGMSQADFKQQVVNRRGRRVSNAPGAPVQGKASIPLPGEVKRQLPQPTRRQTVTAVQRAVTRNATQQGAAASATSQAGMNNWQRYLATNPTARNVVGGLRNLGRGLTALSAGLSFKDKYDQAKAAGASDTRAAIRGGVSAAADVIGGIGGGTLGGMVGTAGGSFTGPGAVVTGTAGAITGGATGANVLRGVADQTFRSLAGPTQQQLDKQRQSNRKKFSDLNLPATNVANNRGIVTGKDGVERVGVRTYRPDGSTYYNVPVRPDTNPISRLAQDMNIPFLSGYYQRQADQQRQQRVRAQKAASR